MQDIPVTQLAYTVQENHWNRSRHVKIVLFIQTLCFSLSAVQLVNSSTQLNRIVSYWALYTFSNVFMIKEVQVIVLKPLSHLNGLVFGTGTSRLRFHKVLLYVYIRGQCAITLIIHNKWKDGCTGFSYMLLSIRCPNKVGTSKQMFIFCQFTVIVMIYYLIMCFVLMSVALAEGSVRGLRLWILCLILH